MCERYVVWHFAAKFVNGVGHEMANVQKATSHGHLLPKRWDGST